MSTPQLSPEYWDHAVHAEELCVHLRALAGLTSPQDLNLRQTVAAELLACEVHLLRQLTEAVGLALGPRVA